MSTTLMIVALVAGCLMAIFNRWTIIAVAVSYQMVRNNDQDLARTFGPQLLAGKPEQDPLRDAVLLIKRKSSHE